MKIVYSHEAISDLIRLRKFIAEKDPKSAARIAKDIVTRVEMLRTFPEAGVIVAQAPEPRIIRDIYIGKYIARYALHSGAITILRVWHHYEDRDAGI